MKITKFVINSDHKSLTIHFTHGEAVCLSFEYLRISTPAVNSSNKQQALVSHKKLVQLMNIEHVAQHGYRLIFDDGHSAIYAGEYLIMLAQEYEQRWQHYLTELQASGHSREAMINITQL